MTISFTKCCERSTETLKYRIHMVGVDSVKRTTYTSMNMIMCEHFYKSNITFYLG